MVVANAGYQFYSGPSIVWSALDMYLYLIFVANMDSTIFIHVLQIEKLRLKEAKQLV